MELPISYTAIFSSAPDVFDRQNGIYPMAPQTDYEEQTKSRNLIRNTVINATRRIICYHQPIYNDERLESSEYVGLQLDVREATVDLVLVQEKYDNAAIVILDDNDSQLLLQTCFCVCIFVAQAIDSVARYKYSYYTEESLIIIIIR